MYFEELPEIHSIDPSLQAAPNKTLQARDKNLPGVLECPPKGATA